MYGTPEELGFDPERLAEIKELISSGLEKGLYPGGIYLIGRKDRILRPECFGTLAPGNSHQVQPDTIYDIASLTKPIATAMSVLILLDQGKVELDQPVSDFFPDEPYPHLSQITIRHLITHTSGLPAWHDLHLEARNSREIIYVLLEMAPVDPPGSTYTYSCLGYILLGAIVELASGQKLDQFTLDNIFAPLEMHDTVFNPAKELMNRVAPTANCPVRRGMLTGEVHDANAWIMGGVSGNAGLFSTAIDLAIFAQMMLSGGQNVISSSAIRLCFDNLIDSQIGGATAGWFIYPNEMLPSGNVLSGQSIGHTGFTGTSLVIDVQCDIFVILLTNRVCMPDDGREFRTVRRLFHALIAQAMLSC